jgi:hypothetical protein
MKNKPIKLDSNYRVDFDTHSIMLVKTETYDVVDKKTQKKTGEQDTQDVKTWHPNLKQCLQEYLDQVGVYEGSIQDVVDRLSSMEKSIKGLEKLYHKKLIA